MIDIQKKEECCGCYSCYNKCPKDAIVMIEDEEGFRYPKIDQDKCIHCDLCEKVCPMLTDPLPKRKKEPQIFAAWSLDEENRKESSSGGIFAEIAKRILQNGGIVVGAGFDDDFNVIHKTVDTVEDLSSIKGSKYVQSQIQDIFLKVKLAIKNHQEVLFVGTPCQVAGLYAFLGNRDDTNLLTADLICHGTPSPKVYHKYLESIKTNKNTKITHINFRNKEEGWKRYSIKIDFEDGSYYYKNIKNDPFMKGFLGNIYLRPACHQCKFANIPRVADITLGDYWGIGNTHPNLDNDKGTSEIIVNSEKGENMVQSLSDTTAFHLTSFTLGLKANPCITGSVPPNPKREAFFKEIDSLNFHELEKKYFPDPTFVVKLMRKIRIESFKIKNKALNLIRRKR